MQLPQFKEVERCRSDDPLVGTYNDGSTYINVLSCLNATSSRIITRGHIIIG